MPCCQRTTRYSECVPASYWAVQLDGDNSTFHNDCRTLDCDSGYEGSR